MVNNIKTLNPFKDLSTNSTLVKPISLRFNKIILHPKLENIHDGRNKDHNKHEFQLGICSERLQYMFSNIHKELVEIRDNYEQKPLIECDNADPDHQLQCPCGEIYLFLGVFAVVPTDELGPPLGLPDAFDGLEYGISNKHAHGVSITRVIKYHRQGLFPSR